MKSKPDRRCRKLLPEKRSLPKILLAELDKDWLVRDWEKPFELWPGIKANVGAYLKEREIEIAD